MSKIKKEELENEEKFVDIPAEDMTEEDSIDETPNTTAEDEEEPKKKRRNLFQWAGDKIAETDWRAVGKKAVKIIIGGTAIAALAGYVGYNIAKKHEDEDDSYEGEIPMLPDSDNIDDIQATETWDNDDDSELTSEDVMITDEEES